MSTVPAHASLDAMQAVMFAFQEKFSWLPSEGQLRSQHWYFKKSAAEMESFLQAYERYEECGRELRGRVRRGW